MKELRIELEEENRKNRLLEEFIAKSRTNRKKVVTTLSETEMNSKVDNKAKSNVLKEDEVVNKNNKFE